MNSVPKVPETLVGVHVHLGTNNYQNVIGPKLLWQQCNSHISMQLLYERPQTFLNIKLKLTETFSNSWATIRLSNSYPALKACWMFTLVVCNEIDTFNFSRPLHLGPEFSDNMVTCRIVVVLTRLPYLALGILVIGCKIKISYFPAGRLVENAPGVDGCLTDDALLHPAPHLGGHLPPPTPSPSH